MRILVTEKGNNILNTIEKSSPPKKTEVHKESIETNKSEEIYSKSIKSVNINNKKPFIIRSDLYNSTEIETRSNIIPTSSFEFNIYNCKRNYTRR